LDRGYNAIEELLSPNSPTFDADSSGLVRDIRFSSTIERMDEDTFE